MASPKLTPREYGLIGSRRRWGEHGRLIRLSELDDVTRAIVVAVLDARQNMEKAAPAIVTPEAAQEASGGSRRRSQTA